MEANIEAMDLKAFSWRPSIKTALPLMRFTDTPACRTALLRLPSKKGGSIGTMVYAVVHITKMLQGDPVKATDVYTKQRPTDKDTDKVRDAAEKARVGPLGMYRQSLAWGAVKVVDEHGQPAGKRPIALFRQKANMSDDDRLKQLHDAIRMRDARSVRRAIKKNNFHSFPQLWKTLTCTVHAT